MKKVRKFKNIDEVVIELSKGLLKKGSKVLLVALKDENIEMLDCSIGENTYPEEQLKEGWGIRDGWV